MSAYILENSLSKPKFRADICRPIDAMMLFPSNEWDSLVVIGEAGIQAVKHAGAAPEDFNIKLNSDEMHKIQDCAVIKREGVVAIPAWVAWAAVGVSVAASIYAYVAAKNIKVPSNVNQTQESPNNRIQARENEARLGQRVEYICGQVRLFPSKIAREYIVIENNEQVEYGYYSVGEGLLELSDTRDGRTSGNLMSGWALSAYGPNQSPMTGDAPFYQIGADIDEPIKTAFVSDEAVRDEIEPPNDLSVSLDLEMTYRGFGVIEIVIIDKPDDYSFLDNYEPGEFVTLVNAFATAQKGTKTLYQINYSGGSTGFSQVTVPINDYVGIYENHVTNQTIKYEIKSVFDGGMELWLPTSVTPEQETAIKRTSNTKLTRSDTSRVDEFANGASIFYSSGLEGDYYSEVEVGDYVKCVITSEPVNGVISGSSSRVLGPFAGQSGIKTIQYNLLSDGLYKDDGSSVSGFKVSGQAIVREIDAAGNITGNSKDEPWELETNQENNRKQAGDTFTITHNYENYTIEFVRDTPRDFAFNGSVVDVVELTELYFMREEPAGASYGNKTTVQTRRRQSTFGIGAAQKINMLAQQSYPDGPSRYLDDTLYYMALNNKFGRRTQQQADKMRTHLREIRQEIVDYFGSEEAAYFDYTFDSTDITFESAVNQVAKAVFASAYQIGSDIRFFPNLLQDVDAMVFSHANKQTGKQTFKYSFTDLQDKGYDCVEVKWRNPANQDAEETIYIPTQGTNPKVVELVGVRNKKKAEVHGWREWYRVKYQRFSYECLVGLEATHLVPGRRVGIVNNIAGVNLDGYVKAWDGDKRIVTSQDVDVSGGGYTLIMSMPQGGTEAFTVTQGRYLDELLLDRKPIFDINTTLMENPQYFRIAKDDDLPRDSYSVQEVRLTDGGIQLVGVNYAPEQYQKDSLMSV